MVHVGKKSPWEIFAVAVLCGYCMTTVACSGFSFAAKNSSGSSSTGGSGEENSPATISGSITPAALGGGVIVLLGGAENATTAADSSGDYSFTGLASGTYTVTPTRAGLVFSPVSQTVTLNGSSVTGTTFSASDKTPQTSTISGSVMPAALGAGISVTLSGGETATTTTDSSGNYSFSGLASGTYTVTPSGAGLVFSPARQSVTVNGSNVTGTDFSASDQIPQTLSISGSITPTTLGMGISVTLSGGETATTTTDGSGNYTFSGLAPGTYRVTPSGAGLVFSPASQSVTVNGSNVTGTDFSASDQIPQTSSISGSIKPATLGVGISVTLSGAETATTTTDTSGNYSFGGLSSGRYTLTPSKSGLVFSPASQSVTVIGSSLTGEDFTVSSPLTPSGPIVIDGESGTVIQGLKITSTTGDCVSIKNSANITILNSEIGPCAGNAVRIYGGTGIGIYDSYIHPETQSPGCCDHNDGIFAYGNPSSLFIQGNVIAYGESNIEVQGGTAVNVIGNLLLNPRGPYPRGQNFQCWSNCSNIVVQNNYALSSTDTSEYLYPDATEDSLSFGLTDTALIQGNFVTGGHSVSGCGIMADTYSNAGTITQNVLLNTAACGIGLTDGSHTANGNRVYNTNPVSGGGNTAMYVAHYGQSSVCGPMTITNNIADEIRSDGYHSGWWDAGSCGSIDTSTDVFGAAADPQLTPVSTVFVPPLIPPQPKNCVVVSPYSTQSSAAPCLP